MKKAIVFPTFWARSSSEGIHEDDFYYDHPLPVDEEGWLPRCFEELQSLDDQDFKTIIVAGANTPEIAEEVQEKQKELIETYADPDRTFVFSYDEFETLSNFCRENDLPVESTLSMEGYSDLRNLCLVAANLLNVDLAISIDDDVVFPDKSYLQTIENDLENDFKGSSIDALGGLYLHHEEQSQYMHVSENAWTSAWNTTELFNRDFQQVIESQRRFHETPFGIMGNIAVTRDFYMTVPLDPAMRRGEDSDWVFNAHLLDRRFVLDSELFVHHLPPERPYPSWQPMREDIARFLYQRKKFRCAVEHEQCAIPSLSFFKPYPGSMWTDELEEKIREGCELLAMEYLGEGRANDAKETLNNLALAHHSFSEIDHDPVQSYLDFQSRWVELMEGLENHAGQLRERLWN